MQDQVQLAGCVITDDYGRILLLHRSDDTHSQWELPGGKVEPEEAIEAAAVREAAEELGVMVRLTKRLGSATFEAEDTAYMYHWFAADIVVGEPQVMEPDAFDDLEYFELEDLPSLALSANMQNLSDQLLDGEVVL